MNPNWLSELPDKTIGKTVTRFMRFAKNWNVAPTDNALKMFLACGVDLAMHELDILEIPDDEWENFYERVRCDLHQI